MFHKALYLRELRKLSNRFYDPELGRYISRDPAQEGLNLYSYCFNNPNSFIDPWGLCSQKPWWEKLGEGYYYGTGFGTEATEWYVQQQLQTGNPLWAIPGSIASLWTPGTYQQTAWTLLITWKLAGWAAQTSPTIIWRGGEIVIKSGEKTIARIAPFGNGPKPGQRNPWYRRLPHYHRRPGIDKHRPWQRGW